MSRWSIAAQKVKDSVSAVEVGEALGLDVDRHGRCACPFHNGKDRNMKLYPGDRGFSCFVCHESGDVIRLAMQCMSLSFVDALKWFEGTFRIGLDLDGRMDDESRRRAENALLRRKKAALEKEQKERMRFDMMLLAEDMVRKLEQMRDDNQPKTVGEAWNESFRTAVELLPKARELAEECAIMCAKEVTE